MLQIMGGSQIPNDTYVIKHKEYGQHELEFEIALASPCYAEINEESQILETTEQQFYIVKQIAAGKKTARITCQLDLIDWQGWVELNYDRSGRPLQFLAGCHPEGWTCEEDGNHQEVLQIELRAATPLELAMKLQEQAGCAIEWDTVRKRAKIIWPDEMPISNAYAVDSVNLAQPPEFKGDSRNYYTRLYAVGGKSSETGETIKLDGLPYVDATPAGMRPICQFWEDTSIEDSATLLLEANKKLAADSKPVRSWNLKILDLYRATPEQWPDMSIQQYTRLRLVDQYKGISTIVQVAEDKVYPYYPAKNEITVSTVAGTVQKTLSLLNDAIYNPNSDFNRNLRRMTGSDKI